MGSKFLWIVVVVSAGIFVLYGCGNDNNGSNTDDSPDTEANCTNNVDDDNDGITDCDDSDCTSNPACAGLPETNCANNVDDDNDGMTDCDDSDCAGDLACPCINDSNCDDGNACTSDECVAGNCSNTYICVAGLVCNRTDGVAPLAVFCDATGGDHGFDTFHDHGYSWDFGDPSAGTWSTTGRSRNTARGPLAAHVFETPGTYTIAVSVKDNSGNITVYSDTIMVQDPDVVFAGSNTVCFSTSSDFAGCPSGADQVTLSAFETAMEQAASGKKRLLFKRGETFSGANRTNLDETGPGIIGAFGNDSEPAPVIDMTYTEDLFQLADGNPQLDDWRIMDLQINGQGSGDVFSAENTINRVTFLRLSMSNVSTGISISTSKPDYYHSPVHRAVAIVDCSLHDLSGYGAFVASEQLMVLGNRVVNTYQHLIRSQYIKEAVYSNNYLDSPTAVSGQAHVLKLHAEPVGGGHDGAERPSSEFVINGNVFIGANNDWNVSIGPQGDSWNETVRNGILDGNHFIAGGGNNLQLHLAGPSITVRNNIFDTSGSRENTAVSVVTRGYVDPDNTNLYNNTCYTNSDQTATCIYVDTSASNTLVHNNLLVAPNASSTSVVSNNGAFTNAGGNLELGVSTFVNPTPTTALDFALSSGSAAIDAGLPTGLAQFDYVGVFRDTDGDGSGGPSPDVGAFEYHGL